VSAGQRHRFFVEELPEAGGALELSKEVARHLRVLRLRVGDEISLFDGSGRQARAWIETLDPPKCSCEAPTDASPDLPEVHLIQAMPKGKKVDQIVRMATELGVDAVHLAISERTISRPDPSQKSGKLARLDKIAREASRQARRRTVPKIHPPRPLTEVVHDAGEESTRLVFWEDAEEFLPQKLDTVSEVWVVVGPEGGLSHTEIEMLAAAGYTALRLGQTILRVETAAPAALSLVLDRVGRIGR
jgi:16S rRNA (uracil1498-N3)-methyltransferase